jgi:hypothetical protein
MMSPIYLYFIIYYRTFMTEITLKDLHKCIKIILNLFEICIFVATFQHKKSSKYTKLF